MAMPSRPAPAALAALLDDRERGTRALRHPAVDDADYLWAS